MDGNIILLGAGAISMMTAGAGAYRLLSAAAKRIDPVLPLAERAVCALEREAAAAEKSAEITDVLHDLREGQEQIRISMSALTLEVQEVIAKVGNHGPNPA